MNRVAVFVDAGQLHHAAFDRHFPGTRPDLVIKVRRDSMDEADDPMLRHALQGSALRTRTPVG